MGWEKYFVTGKQLKNKTVEEYYIQILKKIQRDLFKIYLEKTLLQ